VKRDRAILGNFLDATIVVPLGTETARNYARTRLALKRKGRPIPMNDVWIAAQYLEYGWVLVTEIIPNPHRGESSVGLLARILKQAGVSWEEWLGQ